MSANVILIVCIKRILIDRLKNLPPFISNTKRSYQLMFFFFLFYFFLLLFIYSYCYYYFVLSHSATNTFILQNSTPAHTISKRYLWFRDKKNIENWNQAHTNSKQLLKNYSLLFIVLKFSFFIIFGFSAKSGLLLYSDMLF